MPLLLESDRGSVVLPDDALVIALDDCGHEDRHRENGSCFGVAGCGFMVRDYYRLIEAPWNYMAHNYFPEVVRPIHAVEHFRAISDAQRAALTHFFTRFEFFRLASVASAKTTSDSAASFVNLVTASVLHQIAKIAEQATFSRVFVLVEESERIQHAMLQELAHRRLVSNSGRIDVPIELGTMPKSSAMPAMEVADVVAHTAGCQVRHRNERPNSPPRKDFVDIFQTVDKRLVAFMELLRLEQTKA